MRKGRDVIGLPVICLASGKEIGVVEDLIWSHAELKVTHLVVNGKGGLNRSRCIPFEEVKSIGEDAVTVEDDGLENTDLPPEERRVSEIAGGLVLTEGGRNLGTLEDVFFDNAGGKLLGYEVSTGLVGDLLSGRMIMPPEMVVTWGEEAVIAGYMDLDGSEAHAVSDLPGQPDG